MSTIVLIATMAGRDESFCPLAPSPVSYRQNLGLRVVRGQLSNEALDARSVARLVDTERAGRPTVGWLYRDVDGNRYVVLAPGVREEVYRAYGMDRFNRYAADRSTEPLVEPVFQTPTGIVIESCVKSSG